MVTYLPRTAWTAEPRGGVLLTGSKLRGVSIHWPGTTQAEIGAATQDAIASRLRGYRTFHVDTNGWADIGYQVAGDQAGRVWDLRGIARAPAATASQSNPDANHEWGAFLFVIGQTEHPTPALIEAFQHWRHTRWLAKWSGRTQIRGHGQVPGAQTNCPGTRTLTLIDNGTLAQPPGTEDDMPEPRDLWEYEINDALSGIARPAAQLLENARRSAANALAAVTDVAAAQAAHGALLAQVVAAGTDDLTAEQVTQIIGDAVAAIPALDPVQFAALLAPLLPAVDQADLENALRTVLGSLDNPPA